MKYAIMATTLAVAGLGAVGFGATAAQAERYERWEGSRFPYEMRYHDRCQRKARELHRYEMRAKDDGRLTRWELRTIEGLRNEMRDTCRGYRWRG